MRWTCLLSLLALPVAVEAAPEHPLQMDRTGLRWSLPFTKALERAKTEKRLLLIKPVAFGTSRDGGW